MGFDAADNKVEIFAEGAMSGVLILFGQTAVARHFGSQDGGELTWETVVHVQVRFSDSGR